MALTITHAFVSGVADDPGAAAAGEVLPSQWDAAHVVSAAGGGLDKAILFDKAGVIGEDTNLEWDYTNHILNLGPNARLNSIGTTWEFDVGGTNVLDYNITIASSWNALYWQSIGGTGSFTGFYVKRTGDTGTNQRCSFNLDGHDNGVMTIGVGTADDVQICSTGARTLAITGGSSSAPMAFQLYNTIDVSSGAPTNYERGVFDWTTTSNVLTIGTQKGGSGSTRGMQCVIGNVAAFDFGVTQAGTFTVVNYFRTQSHAELGSESLLVNSVNGYTYAWNGALIGWSASGFVTSAQTLDTGFSRNAAGIVMLTQGATGAHATGLQIYNNTDALTGSGQTNYERGVFDFTTTSNVLTIGTQANGTGTLRNLTINPAGGLVAIGQTTFTDANGNVALTVKGATGTDILNFNDGTRQGSIFIGSASFSFGSVTATPFGFFYGNNLPSVGMNSATDCTLAVGVVLGWTTVANVSGHSIDTGIARSAANVVEINNGTAGTGPGVILPRPTTFANLPASPTQGMMASITDGLAANCADGSCTTFGTNVTGGTGALKLNLWYNGTHWTLIGK